MKRPFLLLGHEEAALIKAAPEERWGPHSTSREAPGMPSPRARPKEAEMDPSAPGPSPWTPAARVSDVPAVTRPASARCAPLCCGDADQGAAPQHHQQPGTRTEFSPGALILGELCPCHPAVTPISSLAVCVIFRGGVPCGLEGLGLGVRGEAGLVPGGPGALSVMLCFPHLAHGCQLSLARPGHPEWPPLPSPLASSGLGSLCLPSPAPLHPCPSGPSQRVLPQASQLPLLRTVSAALRLPAQP
ncbi:zinc finger protein 16 [Phyllostomus discolor]|uniref:Zinc finger protein 16 n=1 Tax=Phyllostomus discolor TaxID=89673 RepID=A0A834E303_9CHIR|nr:zinc finger protein 16 [Phyllostomus discolor]